MSYLSPSSGPPVDPDTLRTLARVANLEIPEEDLADLGTALRDQLAAVRQLDVLDLADVAPITTFDPGWHE